MADGSIATSSSPGTPAAGIPPAPPLPDELDRLLADPDAPHSLRRHLPGLAAFLTGVTVTDTARVAHLVELALDFALQHLKPEGALVTKVFHGSGYSELVELFRANFRVVKAVKPKASRDKSSETFLVGFGLKNPAAR